MVLAVFLVGGLVPHSIDLTHSEMFVNAFLCSSCNFELLSIIIQFYNNAPYLQCSDANLLLASFRLQGSIRAFWYTIVTFMLSTFTITHINFFDLPFLYLNCLQHRFSPIHSVAIFSLTASI